MTSILVFFCSLTCKSALVASFKFKNKAKRADFQENKQKKNTKILEGVYVSPFIAQGLKNKIDVSSVKISDSLQRYRKQNIITGIPSSV